MLRRPRGTGIVVVAAAGNDGDERVGLTSPAYSPRVIAVGAVDTHGSTRYSHWNPLSFSARGDGHRNPDILRRSGMPGVTSSASPSTSPPAA